MSKPLYLVRVGSDERPADKKDIKNIYKQLKKLKLKGDFIVTHHLVTVNHIK